MKKIVRDEVAEKTRVLIADDHSVVIEGIESVLNNEADFEVVGSVKDGSRVLSMVKSVGPDIVILDISMPGLDGIGAAQEIRKWDEKIRILIYSMSSSRRHITSLFRIGVSAYVLKEEPLSELLLALESIKQGAAFYSTFVRQVLQEHMKELELGEGNEVVEVKNGISNLSRREKEVFVLLADGLKPREIAERLCISPKTVETHKYNIMEKLNVSSIAHLTKIALRKDLIDL